MSHLSVGLLPPPPVRRVGLRHEQRDEGGVDDLQRGGDPERRARAQLCSEHASDGEGEQERAAHRQALEDAYRNTYSFSSRLLFVSSTRPARETPRFCARREAGEQSATYAWQIGVMQDEHPSMRSAR